MASAKLPTPEELKAVGRKLGITLSEPDLPFVPETMGGRVPDHPAIQTYHGVHLWALGVKKANSVDRM